MHGLTSRTAQRTVWIVLGAAAGAAVAGSMLNWYEQIVWYDEVVHAGFGFAVTFAAAVWLSPDVLVGWREHGGRLLVVLLLIGLGIGTLWELVEFAYDHLSGPQNVIKGKVDTVVDLLCDAGGALVAAVLAVAMGPD